MKALRWILIGGLIALAIWRLSPQLKDLKEFKNLTQNINWFFIVLAVVSQVSQYIGDGWLSQLCLKIVGISINFEKTIKIAALNVFAAHILPVGEAGVIATVYYFYKKLGVDNQSLIFLTLFWSISTGISLAIMLVASMLFLPKIPSLEIHISRIVLYILVALLLLLLVLFTTRRSLWPKIEKLLRGFAPTREIIKFADNLNVYKNDLAKNKVLVLKAVIAGFIYYAGNIATLAFCFLAFGKLPPLSLVTFTYFISLVAGWITLAPAGIGATEATMVIIFHEFGVEPALSLAAMLSFRLISFWLPIPTGALAYFQLKKEIQT